MGHESEAVAQELMSTVQRQAVATQGLMGPKTHQGSLPQLDRPLPIRKRQRKPAKAPRVVEVEAESFPVASPNRRGRKPKAASKTFLHIPCCWLVPLVCCSFMQLLSKLDQESSSSVS